MNNRSVQWPDSAVTSSKVSQPQPTYEDLLTASSAMDQILGLVGGRGIPSLSGGLDISLGSATQLRLWSSTSEPETDEIINKTHPDHLLG